MTLATPPPESLLDALLVMFPDRRWMGKGNTVYEVYLSCNQDQRREVRILLGRWPSESEEMDRTKV